MQRHRLLTWGIVAALVLRGVFVSATALRRQLGVVHLRRAADLDRLADVPATATTAAARRRSWTSSRRSSEPVGVDGGGRGAGDRRHRLRHRLRCRRSWRCTDDPFIVFAANAFALLGLAPLFFLVADLAERLYYLKTALAALLVLIGFKMAAGELWGKLGPEYSLPDARWSSAPASWRRCCATGAWRASPSASTSPTPSAA